MSQARVELTYRQVLVFWAPLAATWLMMAAEGPFLAAVIARMAAPRFNLAAYGVAFSLAVLIEAPIIMIMSASTALVKDKDSYLRLRNFTFTLIAAVTTAMILFLIPPVFRLVVRGVIGLPEEVARLTYRACWALLPWPGAIGYRRFYQGILISRDLTRRVAYGTAVRLASITATGLILYHFSSIEGAILGGSALGLSVTLEAAASRLMAASSVKRLCRAETTSPRPALTYRYIARFYYPLALTSLLGLGVHPLVTFFLGKSRMGLDSLAVMPVVLSLVFIFRSLGLSYQEVAIALLGRDSRSLGRLRNFAALLALTVSGALAVIAFTPISRLWFRDLSGLTDSLTQFSVVPARIMAVIPALTVWISLQRGVLVEYKQTTPITLATAIEVAGIFGMLALTIHGLDMVGAAGAALSLIVGRTLANLYLVIPCTQIRKKTGRHLQIEAA